jgi:pectin methylesterase-like acyl-CoA thioesterase
MSIYKSHLTLFPVRIFSIVGLGFILTAFGASAAVSTWNGPATTNTANVWSGANWTPSAPGTADDVKFFDVGAIPGVSNINNTVDATLTIGSLQYGNTNNNHTTLINSGVTLTITNANGLFVGTPTTASPSTQVVNATVTGAGALVVSNRSAFLVVNQGASAVGTERSTLDLTGLNTFSSTVKNIFVGSTGNGSGTTPTGNGVGETGTLLLGKTNVITVVYAPASSNYPTNVMAFQAGISVGYNGAASAGGTSFLYLGQNNTLNVDSISVGQTKGLASMLFGSAFTNNNPTAVFRGTNGGTTRVSYWAVGDTGTRGGSGSGRGTNDFTYGTLDAMVNIMILGQDTWAGSGAPGDTASATSLGSYGVFNFPKGNLDVNTLTLGNVQSTVVANTLPCLGVMNVGSNATLRVNTVLQMSFTQTNGTGASSQFTYGNLNVTNGTVFANSITVGTYTASANNRINLTNATLIVSNVLATSANPLTNYYTANSLLGLTITSDSATKAFVGTLTTAGSTNVIQLGATPVFFGSYPAQIALIKYSSLAGSGYNFGLTNVPGWAPGASLSNNAVNKSIDLVLPSDPRPVISVQPASYSGNPGDNVTFSVTAGGVAPLSYQWRTNGVNINDGATGNGSTNFGSTTAVLGVTNAQSADSVNTPGYTVVITNVYGSVTSSPAVLTINGGSLPVITGPQNQTAIQGNNATFSASVAANPAATIYWQTSGTNIPGANSSTLVVSNVQYPVNDQQVYSIIATNSFGSVTNSATLTVIVPPAITTQPSSVVVTNTQSASFTVVASGVPAPGYVWKKNGVPIVNGGTISGANLATLSISAATASDISTSYSVTITNAAGTTNSVAVSLTVNSLMSVTAVSPTNGATGLCYDTTLAVTFSTPPVLRKGGTIKIFNSTNTVTPVDTIDLSLNVDNPNGGAGPLNIATNIQPRFIEGIQYSSFPVIITGTTAAIYPHSGVMTSNQTYYVTIDNGCFTDTNGAYFAGLTDTNFWRFTTKPTGPANSTNLVVAADGSGDFLTVQGAADSIPTNNTSYTLVNIRNGTYTEIVCVQNRNNITFRGQNRNATRIAYANNNNMNSGFNGQQTCSTFRCNANDISIENLTITNTTPQGGSQAFALQVGNNSQRFIALNAEFSSYQDTILVANPPTGAYFRDSLIQGDVDYIWGGGTMFFTNCEMRTLRTTGGYVTNPRAAAGTNGISFMKCSFTVPSSAYTNSVFARAITVANGNTALINCRVDTNGYTGWFKTDVTNTTLNLRWWEYGNTSLDGSTAVTFNGTQLASTDQNLTNASSATLWLYGWVPQLSPNILTNPVSQSVGGGQSASFAVTATGIPNPTYQWLKNGSPLSGQTNASLAISGANANNAGSYSVIVSNSAGVVTSSSATLIVSNTAPTLTPVADQTVSVGANLSITNVANDPDVPAQTLAFSLLAGPSGAAVNSSSGVFTWVPAPGQANTTNNVQVVVTDNGTPNLSATNSFKATVLPNVAVFSGLTASQSVTYGTPGIVLSGTVSATGPAYPANGEAISVTINGNTQNTTVNDSTGDFSITYNSATLPASGTAYPISYSYAGNSQLTSASDTSTALTVNQAALTVTANSTSKSYGQTVAFAGTEFTTSGLTNGDSVTSVTLTSAGATNAAIVGSYPIVPSAATGTGLGNYNITYSNGTLAVNPASTSVGASSTKNPSGYKDTVSFLATLPADASGSVVFSSANGPISTNAVSSGSATSLSITNLPRGTNVITASYLGDSNYLGSTNMLNQVVTNHPPVANNVGYTRNVAVSSFKVLVSDLLTNATDVDSDALALASVSTTTNNATITVSGGYVMYSNTNAVADQFSYTVSDGFGGTNSAAVTINIDTTPLFGQSQVVSTTGGTATLNFTGIPGYSYSVSRSTDLLSWSVIWTTNAPAGGLFQFIDTSAPLDNAYYRLQYNP